MNQKSLIHLYNSMFDETESEEEIKDSANDSHNELNGLSKQENPELFDCIYNMCTDNNYGLNRPNIEKSNELQLNISANTKYFNKDTLNKIKKIYVPNYGPSYFENFNPKDGDFSIIFKYKLF